MAVKVHWGATITSSFTGKCWWCKNGYWVGSELVKCNGKWVHSYHYVRGDRETMLPYDGK